MPLHRPIVIVSGRRRPHEILLLATSVPLGVGMLATAPTPQSMMAVMPAWLVTVWAVSLVVSGAVGLVAIWWRGDPLRALRAEAGSLIINAGALITFAGAAFVVAGWRAWFVGGFFAGWGVANLWRAAQIGRETREMIELGRGRQ